MLTTTSTKSEREREREREGGCRFWRIYAEKLPTAVNYGVEHIWRERERERERERGLGEEVRTGSNLSVVLSCVFRETGKETREMDGWIEERDSERGEKV